MEPKSPTIETNEPTTPPVALSSREREVVALIAQARKNKHIAQELNLTEGTVKEYLNRIFKKLGVKNRTDLAVWAHKNDRAGK